MNLTGVKLMDRENMSDEHEIEEFLTFCGNGKTVVLFRDGDIHCIGQVLTAERTGDEITGDVYLPDNEITEKFIENGVVSLGIYGFSMSEWGVELYAKH